MRESVMGLQVPEVNALLIVGMVVAAENIWGDTDVSFLILVKVFDQRLCSWVVVFKPRYFVDGTDR